MKNYKIIKEVHGTYEIYVRANSEKEAREKVKNGAEGDLNFSDISYSMNRVIIVKEIPE